MKKMMMFLLMAAMVAPAMAQQGRGNHQDDEYRNDRNGAYSNNDGRDNRYDDRYNKGAYNYTKAERDAQLDRVNREYDYKIRNVSNNFFMNRYKKERLIRELQEQRRDEIRRIYARYSDQRNTCGDYKPGRRHP